MSQLQVIVVQAQPGRTRRRFGEAGGRNLAIQQILSEPNPNVANCEQHVGPSTLSYL
jgi:hypothetical protein